MDKEDYHLIIETSLLLNEGVSEKEIVEQYGIPQGFIEIGKKINRIIMEIG
jgi:hypothetical protein|tara:strand:- start:1330 stop:1482 length:153 start_codon:yes stop_codon:yes gene_type:complete